MGVQMVPKSLGLRTLECPRELTTQPQMKEPGGPFRIRAGITSDEGQAAWLGNSLPWGHRQHLAWDERCQPPPPSQEHTHVHHADGFAQTLSNLTPPWTLWRCSEPRNDGEGPISA